MITAENAKRANSSSLSLVNSGSIADFTASAGLETVDTAAITSAATKIVQQFVPYRDSLLTYLLKDSLGGNSKTHMIASKLKIITIPKVF